MNKKIEACKMQHKERDGKKKKGIKENLKDVETKKQSRSSDICLIIIQVRNNSVHREGEIVEMMAEKYLELKTEMSPHIKKLDKK